VRGGEEERQEVRLLRGTRPEVGAADARAGPAGGESAERQAPATIEKARRRLGQSTKKMTKWRSKRNRCFVLTVWVGERAEQLVEEPRKSHYPW
jgi:hypothetical protein